MQWIVSSDRVDECVLYANFCRSQSSKMNNTMAKICRIVGGKRRESCLIDKRGKYGF